MSTPTLTEIRRVGADPWYSQPSTRKLRGALSCSEKLNEGIACVKVHSCFVGKQFLGFFFADLVVQVYFFPKVEIPIRHWTSTGTTQPRPPAR